MTGGGAFIAVVDDDGSVREAVPNLVRALGHACSAFSSAEDFLASASVHSTDCLVLDISMPGMSGIELQEELRRRDHQIPIVFITAHADDELRTRLRDSGAVECLSKPFSGSALQAAIALALNGHSSVREAPAP
jgi:FixJ family two-component response regulator